MKIFGSSRYIKVEGEYKDVEPNEEYLQFEVKSQWDWNAHNNFLVYKNGFSYYIVYESKSSNDKYTFSKRLREDEITEEYRELINKYLNKENL